MNTRSLTIMMVTNNYTPYSGGVVSSLNSLCAQLTRLGHRVVIVTLDFLGPDHTDPAGVIRLYCPLRFTYKGRYCAVPYRPRKQLAEIIEQLKPDIIHTHHPFLLGISAAAVAHAYTIPVVFTYHTLYQEYAHYIPLPRALVRAFIARRVRNYCRGVDGVIAPSSSIARYLKSFTCKPIAIIPSGIQHSFVHDTYPRTHETQHEPFHFLYVGRFAQEKNMYTLLDVIATIVRTNATVQCTLIGYGPLEDDVRKYAYQTLSLSPERVQFIHKPERSVIVQYYRTAHLLLFASSTDTQGLVLAEAMAGGMPVVALDGPGQADMIVNGQNGFLVSTTQQMASHACAIATDSDLWQKLSHNAWQTSLNFTPARVTERLVTYYRSIIDQCTSGISSTYPKNG